MNTEELLQQYPLKRIKPEDGMAVTQEVWEEAHEYHRKAQNLHTLFAHGSGIITGLEVIASDPPDTSVYILPGVAIDPAGQMILLPQPVSYDIGNEMEGRLYLLLNYGESHPRKSDNGNRDEGAPLYIHSEFAITAQTVLPGTPYVELARVNRSSRDSTFGNAQNPVQPGLDELDLRFRREIGAPPEVSIAVTYLGQVVDRKQGRGANYLAQALNYTGDYYITVEDDVPLGPAIVTKTLVYLVGQGEFELDQVQINGLRNYVHRGKGTLLIESVDGAAETSFLNFLQTAGMRPENLPAASRLLSQPYLFAAPPAGFETQDNPKLLMSEGVVFSTHNYGLLWQGERRGRLASREEIRSAIEWGGNIITYSVERRRTGGKR
jgi:hypothetical protein